MDDPAALAERLITAGPVLVVRRTVDEIASYVSPNVSGILGYAPEDVTDVPGFWPEHVHPDDLERVRAEVESAWRTGASKLRRSYRFLHKDGVYRWLHTTVGFQYEDAGEPAAIVEYALDATEQQQVEDEFRRSQERTRAVLRAAREAFVSMDEQGVISEWNAQAERIFGWTPREAIGRSLAETIVPERHRAEHRRGLERFLATGEGPLLDKRIQVTALRRDGSEFPVELTIAAVRTRDGYVFHALIHDITERARAEAAVREREAALQAVLAASPDIITMVRPGGGLAPASRAVRDVLGYDPEEYARMDRMALIHPDDRDQVEESLRSLLQGGPPVVSRFRVAHADGHWVVLESHSQAIMNDDGHPVGVTAVARDVTQNVALEEAILSAKQQADRAKEEADRANRAKSEFLARMSHELRTPLNAILGFAQLLEMDPLRSEERESVEQILKAGRHLLELINEVLDIARIEEGKLSLSVEPVRVGEALTDALDLVKPLAAQRGVRIDIEDAPLCDRYVMADRQRLKQVLLNLLVNAIKYNHEDGRVMVSCRTEPERLRISVADTGPGIRSEDLERLFAPFERLGAEQGGVEGTGIGLTLSKRLVELMDGRIGVESTIGVGSTFWVEFALADRGSESENDDGAPDGNGGTVRERTLLYIEDNLSNLRLIERILARRPQVRLLSAMQGGLGAELARQHRPDLVLLDVHLPDMRGEEVLARLRSDPTTVDIPVVIISAEATKPKIQRFLAAGARAYLTKPLDVARFLEIVDDTLGGGGP